MPTGQLHVEDSKGHSLKATQAAGLASPQLAPAVQEESRAFLEMCAAGPLCFGPSHVFRKSADYAALSGQNLHQSVDENSLFVCWYDLALCQLSKFRGTEISLTVYLQSFKCRAGRGTAA